MTPEQLWQLIESDADCVPYLTVNEPKDPDYRSKDAAIAAILNGKGFGDSRREVPAWWAKRALVKRGKWRGMVEAANSHANAQVKAAAQAAVDLGSDPNMQVDFADPAEEVVGMWTALVAAGLVSVEERDLIVGFSIVPGGITPEQVSVAVRGPRE